jgi:hypothetical protein
MSKLKVNELDTESGTTIEVATTKTLSVPAGASLTVEGTANLTSSTLTLPATLPATAGTNITSIPGANITGTIPAAALSNVDTSSLEDDIALLGFKVAANGSLAKYNLDDQTVDAFIDATGIDAVASTNAIRSPSSNYYYGSSAATTGGTKTAYSSGGIDYIVHTLTSTGAYTSTVTVVTDYFIVAGGGSGGGQHGAGGGAGGYLTAAALSFPAGTYTATVGTGGASVIGTAAQVAGIDGINTTLSGPGGFTTLTALKGGGGPGVGPVSQPASWYQGVGGSGTYGSGSGGTSSLASAVGGVGTAGQGYNGGVGNGTSGISTVAGGGGGGGGSIGGTGAGTSGATGGNGGTGIQNLYQTGVNQWYVGGGGGRGGTTGGTSGSGVGGAGGSNVTPTGGATNTGSGGGGSASNVASGAGADGIVILRIDSSLVGNLPLTLQSNATTAETAPTKGDIVMTYTNGIGTATLNTDLTAEFSADNGSNWTSMTLDAQGTTGTHLIVSAHDVTVGTAGTEMKYRIKTLNQGIAKQTRIQAVSLGWS